MSGFVLRVIAMLTMLTDHIGWNFLERPMMLTWIGRVAFPLYAVLLADGYHCIHTDQDRLSRHLSTMLILAVVSEFGYDLMDERLVFSHYLDSQSNLITLLCGYVGMLATETLAPSTQSGGKCASGTRLVPLLCAYGLLGFANYMAHGNFNLVGPWLVIALYWYLRASRKAEAAGAAWSWGKRLLILVSGFAVYLVLYFWVRSGFGPPLRLWKEVVDFAPWIVGHLIAAFLISRYNGTLGYHGKWFRRLYTSFYPAHMYVIGIICILMGKQ